MSRSDRTRPGGGVPVVLGLVAAPVVPVALFALVEGIRANDVAMAVVAAAVVVVVAIGLATALVIDRAGRARRAPEARLEPPESNADRTEHLSGGTS